jgi:hypothetical protein
LIVIVVKHSYDKFQVTEPDLVEGLREVCDPNYDGPLSPTYILDPFISDTEPLMELTIIDDIDGEPVVIFDDQL